MLEFSVTKRSIILRYRPEIRSGIWVVEQLKGGVAKLSRVFHFRQEDLIGTIDELDLNDLDDHQFSFRFGAKDGDYFRIAGRIFNIANDVLIDPNDIELTRKTFVAERDISIMRRLSKLLPAGEPIKLGGSDDDAIPAPLFQTMLARFPNTLEVNRYAEARIATILEGMLNPFADARRKYEDYLSKRGSVWANQRLPKVELLQGEIDKFEYVRGVIADTLYTGANYTEADWQRLIVELLLLIFPKYVVVLQRVRLEDRYTVPGDRTRREIDIALVDANGNLDIIEVKKPFENALLAKAEYRNNFVPAKELGGTIMQAEKYLFHLAKWGVVGEQRLTSRYGKELPQGLTIKITSPKAMIIIGRDQSVGGEPALSDRQLFDFEIIKRKYANMIDILHACVRRISSGPGIPGSALLSIRRSRLALAALGMAPAVPALLTKPRPSLIQVARRTYVLTIDVTGKDEASGRRRDKCLQSPPRFHSLLLRPALHQTRRRSCFPFMKRPAKRIYGVMQRPLRPPLAISSCSPRTVGSGSRAMPKSRSSSPAISSAFAIASGGT